ncbi:MAG: hydrogenase maturation protease, partial [Bacteroidales bacterium]
MKKDILVLGIGNLILSDEGVGIHTVNYFAENNPYDNVDSLDGGTGGLSLIGILQSYDHVIMVDATLDTLPTGTVRRITPHYSSDYPILMSAHEIGIKEMVDAMILQDCIPHIELIVMSVTNIQEIG